MISKQILVVCYALVDARCCELDEATKSVPISGMTRSLQPLVPITLDLIRSKKPPDAEAAHSAYRPFHHIGAVFSRRTPERASMPAMVAPHEKFTFRPAFLAASHSESNSP